ncbi:hypothetical protein ES319_A11G312400v1 [Gossypium barbadense]|uniref:Uncharacterized protein n=2 Tax=Gossypium TaxID=3633 RepID=A0A5J5TZW0_GOSBA|nr:hypothetical protein ES319_A11G312400v1 [Gossypium barbadense]TYG96333.1 hypothetical protein ES288_A11G341900v1 [Gossypium darwinii]
MRDQNPALASKSHLYFDCSEEDGLRSLSVYGVVMLTWRGRSWGVTRSLPEA